MAPRAASSPGVGGYEILALAHFQFDPEPTQGVPPPASAYPRAADGDPRTAGLAKYRFPVNPGRRATAKQSTRIPSRITVHSCGPTAAMSPRYQPVPVPGTEHILLAPKVDDVGNDVAALRRRDDLETPLAAVTGWNLRRDAYRANDLCGCSGMLIPFPHTRADRIAAHDPRLSIEKRIQLRTITQDVSLWRR